MKSLRLPAVSVALLLCGFGCSPLPAAQTPSIPPVADGSFAPPTGADLSSGLETPGRRRLMTATSSDGLTFTRTNRVLADQANVPDLVTDADGVIYLYYAGWEMGKVNNGTAVAISRDQGATWSFHNVERTGSDDLTHSGDPDVVILPDGTFRLYSTFNLPGSQDEAIYYSEGTDGVHFAEMGIAYRSAPPALDSNTYLAGSIWHMLTLSGRTVAAHHATSADGKTFVDADLAEHKIDGEPMVLSNVIAATGGYRLYAFGGNPQSIQSFFSTDGNAWTPEAGTRLALDPTAGLESAYVKDPAVLRLKDGSYLMVYVTQIP